MAKRVKTVYDTSEIAHLWAHGLDDRPDGVRGLLRGRVAPEVRIGIRTPRP